MIRRLGVAEIDMHTLSQCLGLPEGSRVVRVMENRPHDCNAPDTFLVWIESDQLGEVPTGCIIPSIRLQVEQRKCTINP